MRGKQVKFSLLCIAGGITPAHAGKTVRAIKFGMRTRDHPRACGENILSILCLLVNRGSPPRMRGKRFDDLFKIIGYRITPAHAGKTFSVPLSSGRFQDHPRACGENRNCPKAKQKAHGSPPRMRGKRVPTGAAMPLPGITPAHAGKTSAGGLGMNAIKDHPRACGENINAALNQRIDIGSPPRMRGKRLTYACR